MITDVLDELVKRGYVLAAKNTFQLHRLLNVDGEVTLFHVDLIHRRYADDAASLVKHWGAYSSIAAPGTDVIFMHNQRRKKRLTITLPSGHKEAMDISFCDEIGVLATKGRSVGFGKRVRDGFDVFLVIRQSRDKEALIKDCKALLKNPIFRQSLIRLRDQMKEPNVQEDAASALASMTGWAHGEASRMITEEMKEFFIRIGI